MNAQKFNLLICSIKHKEQAIEEIYKEYHPKIVLHVRRKFGRAVNAEDISHEVFLSLMRLDITEYIRYPTAWLFTLADNKVKDILKYRHGEDAIPETTVFDFDVDSTLLSVDMVRAFEHIDPLSQRILYLHYWEGYSHKEIAKLLHMSCGNVRLKASRAYKELKKYL